MRITRARVPFPVAAALGALLALAPGAAPAHAQVVWATVVGKNDGRPVRGARVYLVRESGMAVDSATSDGDGRARLTADTAGTFVLYAHIEGYAAFASAPFRLRTHEMLQQQFALPLISIATLQRIGAMVRDDPMLQRNMSTICGEKPRVGTGIVLGVVRARVSQTPVAGALVSLTPPAPDTTVEQKAREKPRPAITGVSNEHGTYVLCNVPAGDAVLQARAEGWRPGNASLRVQAGIVLWQDLTLEPAAPPRDPPPTQHRP